MLDIVNASQCPAKEADMNMLNDKGYGYGYGHGYGHGNGGRYEDLYREGNGLGYGYHFGRGYGLVYGDNDGHGLGLGKGYGFTNGDGRAKELTEERLDYITPVILDDDIKTAVCQMHTIS